MVDKSVAEQSHARHARLVLGEIALERTQRHARGQKVVRSVQVVLVEVFHAHALLSTQAWPHVHVERESKVVGAVALGYEKLQVALFVAELFLIFHQMMF